MSDKVPGNYSLLRAIRNCLERGTPRDAELIADAQVRQEVNRDPRLSELLSHGRIPGAVSFFLPNRAVDTGNAAAIVGKELRHSSDLLGRSAVVENGATVYGT